jgi:hypothetical protein
MVKPTNDHRLKKHSVTNGHKSAKSLRKAFKLVGEALKRAGKPVMKWLVAGAPYAVILHDAIKTSEPIIKVWLSAHGA